MYGEWVSSIESKISTYIKAKTINKLKTAYPNIEYSTTKMTYTSTSKFPSVYQHLLPCIELMRDLKGKDVNCVTATIQVRVTSKSKTDAEKVAYEVLGVYKQLSFEVIAFPDTEINDAKLYEANMRFRRKLTALELETLFK